MRNPVIQPIALHASSRQTVGLRTIWAVQHFFLGRSTLIVWAVWHVRAKMLRRLRGIKHWLLQQLQYRTLILRR